MACCKMNRCCSLVCWIINFILICAAVGGGVVTLYASSDDFSKVKNLYWYRNPIDLFTADKKGEYTFIYYNAKFACSDSVAYNNGTCLEYSDNLAGKALGITYQKTGSSTEASSWQEAVVVLIIVAFSLTGVGFLCMPLFFFPKFDKVYFFSTITCTFFAFALYMSAFAIYVARLAGPVPLVVKNKDWECPIEPDTSELPQNIVDKYSERLKDLPWNCNYGPGFGCCAGVWCVLFIACIGICIGGKSLKKDGK